MNKRTAAEKLASLVNKSHLWCGRKKKVWLLQIYWKRNWRCLLRPQYKGGRNSMFRHSSLWRKTAVKFIIFCCRRSGMRRPLTTIILQDLANISKCTISPTGRSPGEFSRFFEFNLASRLRFGWRAGNWRAIEGFVKTPAPLGFDVECWWRVSLIYHEFAILCSLHGCRSSSSEFWPKFEWSVRTKNRS